MGPVSPIGPKTASGIMFFLHNLFRRVPEGLYKLYRITFQSQLGHNYCQKGTFEGDPKDLFD